MEQVSTVGIYSPGDMGMAIGQVLAANGIRPVAALEGRSERTRGLAGEAGIEDVGSIEAMVQAADLIMSVLVPSESVPAAQRVAEALRETGSTLVYADCNAVAPSTGEEVARVIEDAGGRYVDASIIGPPPRKPGVCRIYASGPHAAAFAQLNDHGLDIPVLGDRVGMAKGIKLCYASMTKGFMALSAELWMAAAKLGIMEPFRAELETSQQAMLQWQERMLPNMPPKAFRFIGEMEEHAKGFQALGLTPRMMEGSVDLYRHVAETPAGKETVEQADKSLPLEDLIRRLL